MVSKDHQEQLTVEDIQTIQPLKVHVTTSAVKDYRKTYPTSTVREARTAIQDLLIEAIEAETLYETPTGYVRARVGRHISVMLSSDLQVAVAMHDDGRNPAVPKRNKRVATNAEELKDILNPDTIHIGEAALQVFAHECELEPDAANIEFRVALQEALETGYIRDEPNRHRQGEVVFVIEDDEFAYSVFPDGGMVFSCLPLD